MAERGKPVYEENGMNCRKIEIRIQADKNKQMIPAGIVSLADCFMVKVSAIKNNT